VVALYGQFIHLQGLAQLLFARMLEGPAFLQADQHQVVAVREDQGFPLGRDLRRSYPEALVAFQLPPLQDHQETFARAPEFQIEGLPCGQAAGFEDGEALGGQGIQGGADLQFGLHGPGEGAFSLTFQRLPQPAQRLKAEAETGGHQLPAFKKGARSMPKIWPMASMASRWLELSAVACRRKAWMAGWNWMAWSMAVLDPLV